MGLHSGHAFRLRLCDFGQNPQATQRISWALLALYSDAADNFCNRCCLGLAKKLDPRALKCVNNYHEIVNKDEYRRLPHSAFANTFECSAPSTKLRAVLLFGDFARQVEFS